MSLNLEEAGSSENFKLDSQGSSHSLSIFHDESGITHKWLHHGILVVENHHLNDLLTFLKKLRQDSGSEKDVHFSDLSNTSEKSKTTKLACLLAESAKGPLWRYARFYFLGVNLENLERSVFGEDKTTINENIYNRFFEIAIHSALGWFFPSPRKAQVTQVFSEHRKIALGNGFTWRAPYKINMKDRHFSFLTNTIQMLDGSISKETKFPQYVPLLQLVDVLLGTIRQLHDPTTRKPAALEVSSHLIEPVNQLAKHRYNLTHDLYKRLQIAWFPKSKMNTQDIFERKYSNMFFSRSISNSNQATFSW